MRVAILSICLLALIPGAAYSQSALYLFQDYDGPDSDALYAYEHGYEHGQLGSLCGSAWDDCVHDVCHLEPMVTDCPPLCETTAECQACPREAPHGLWVRGEYLMWWTRGMRLPPLVTTSPAGTEAVDAGVLGQPGTKILYGNSDVLKNFHSGGRITFGRWLVSRQRLGVEADFWGLGTISESFNAASDGGSPILARPFFNINPRDPFTGDFDPPARQDSELVGYPEIIDGRVSVDSSNRVRGAGVRFVYNLCGCKKPKCSLSTSCGDGHRPRVDLLVGYRYLNMKDHLRVAESLTSLLPEIPGSFDISDSFETQNTFNGVDVGMLWQNKWNRWSLELLGKVALGNTHQVVAIDGRTTTTVSGVEDTETGGLLASSSNIGRHKRDNLSVVPEFGVTAGYCVTRNLRATIGYTMLYWSQVARAGDQIDLDVNPDLIPPPVDPVTGAQRPRFVFNDTYFWAQGINFGLDFRF